MREKANKYENKRDNSKLGGIIKIIGIIVIVAGIVVGFVLANDKFSGFDFFTALIYWGIGLISGLLLFAFGEVIYLVNFTADTNRFILEELTEINNKLITNATEKIENETAR